MSERAMVVTTINNPTPPVLELAARSAEWPLLVVGDAKTPADWHVDGVQFLSIGDQSKSGFRLAGLLPINHYCRKNLGYLTAIGSGARFLAETDDDNYPRAWPAGSPEPTLEARLLGTDGWANVYCYFTDETIWPRGLPLPEIHTELPGWDSLPTARKRIGVHQYLASGDPDVDAIYRMTVGKVDHKFKNRALILDKGTAVPFNSQSTVWLRDAFPLLYLPSFVSFRMTDIWRSFVAQICMWASDLHVAYHGDGVFQERNVHDLQKDFLQEVIGYQRNDEIFKVLSSLHLEPGAEGIGANLLTCYRSLHDIGIVPDEEMPLVKAWLDDVESVTVQLDR